MNPILSMAAAIVVAVLNKVDISRNTYLLIRGTTATNTSNTIRVRRSSVASQKVRWLVFRAEPGSQGARSGHIGNMYATSNAAEAGCPAR